MEQSKRWQLNIEDVKKVGKNALIFLAPLLIVVLNELSAGKPVEEIVVLVKLWVLNTAVDLLRKLYAGETK